ncbi:hypothetical protein OAP63_18310 [Vibrio sp.]|uniref:Flavodoxin n=1 Tax=Vibrio viridaestus TaxID=2487322 RepID=A0A3N9TKD3_9VIBR|nr:hypothetical protein [Vibrio viridaestus]MDC0612691.1 hypothetical protein [Vibrio sp.]RQW64809.1 hypothetical protein EES38_01850 [Vibrio viridaestus]
MTTEATDIVTAKNEWLRSHITVEYPTKESVEGFQIQLTHSELCDVIEYSPITMNDTVLFDVFPVNFHRLTVYFAVLQSKMYPLTTDQEKVIEFFTQIIYSEPCSMYLGFRNSQPVFAAMVTVQEDSILVSNLVCVDPSVSQESAASYLLSQLSEYKSNDYKIFLESNPSFYIQL